VNVGHPRCLRRCHDDLVRCALRLKGQSLRHRVERLYYLLQEPKRAA